MQEVDNAGKLAAPWSYTYEQLMQGLYFHGHSSVFVNEGKPNVTLFAEPSPELVVKRASWGSGRIILIDPKQLNQALDGEKESDNDLGYSRIVLPDAQSQLAHSRMAQLGHSDTTDGPRTVWRLSHKVLRDLEKSQYAVHVPLLESKSSFFNNAGLDLPSIQAWHFFEVVKAFVGGADVPKEVLEQYHPLLTTLNAHHVAQGSNGKLLLPCVVGGGLAKPSHYTSVNTDFLNRITGAYRISQHAFEPDNASHMAHLKGMPKDFYLWLNALIIGNEEKPVVVNELIEVWESVMR